jgi:hypothetical protein
MGRHMADVHELVSFKFRPEFDRDLQFGTMSDLEPLMLAQPGLLLREYFHSERDGVWVTHLAWVDEASIDTATPRLEADPTAAELFDRFDPASMHYARFERVGRTEVAAADRFDFGT